MPSLADSVATAAPPAAATGEDRQPLTRRQLAVLLLSVWIIAVCGLVYELIIGTLSSYLLGNSVTQFSLTIGFFLCAMGLGSFASRWVRRDVLDAFVVVEIAIGLIGGGSAALLYGVFALTSLYYPAMFIGILLIGGCMGLEIPLLTRLSTGRDQLRQALANVFTFDYLGALVGSVLFPLVLLPQLGILRSSLVMGLLNLAVAAWIVATFRARLRRWRRLAAVIGIGAAALVAGVAWSARLSSFLERQLYADEIVYARQTPYQRIVITRWGDDLRLYLDGNLQFSLVDEYRYHEALVHPAMTLGGSHRSVLVLGGGDGLAVREILRYPDVRRVVLVDIDPAMTTLAREHTALRDANGDALRDPRVHLVHEDAFKYLGEGTEPFNVILADLPDPNNESLAKLYSTTFYELIRRRLTADGVMACQATSPYFARAAYWCIVDTVSAACFDVVPYHVYVPSFGDWGFVLAGPGLRRSDTYAPALPMRFLDADAFRAARLFGPDVGRVPTAVSTLDHPVVLEHYEAGWRRHRPREVD